MRRLFALGGRQSAVAFRLTSRWDVVDYHVSSLSQSEFIVVCDSHSDGIMALTFNDRTTRGIAERNPIAETYQQHILSFIPMLRQYKLFEAADHLEQCVLGTLERQPLLDLSACLVHLPRLTFFCSKLSLFLNTFLMFIFSALPKVCGLEGRNQSRSDRVGAMQF